MSLLSQYKVFAIIQTAFLGDVCLSLPMAEALRANREDAKILFITTPGGAQIARTSTAIDEVIEFDKKNRQKKIKDIKVFAQSLKKYNIDCVIAPHKSARTAILTHYIKPRFSVSYDNSALGVVYSKKVPNVFAHNEIERNLDLLRAFSDANIEPISKPNIQFSNDDIEHISALIAENNLLGGRLVGIAPGSVWATKRWTLEGFSELTKIFIANGYAPILLGGSGDVEVCEAILKDNPKAVSFAGKTNLSQMMNVVSRLGVLICNDSAPTHLAGLTETPTVAIFGSTVKYFGFACWESLKVAENNLLKCRPCGIHGHKTCPLGTLECMKSVSAESVYAMALEIMK